METADDVKPLGLLLVLLPLMAGCATRQPVPKTRAVLAPPPTITLQWKPNYTFTNEVTVIISSQNLLLPRSQWLVVFAGSTNQCTLPKTLDYAFFSAYNTITNK